MQPIYTQHLAMDAWIRETLCISGSTLMLEAGHQCFRALQACKTLRKVWACPRPIIWVLCGGGHNGGDGWVLARLIKQAYPMSQCHILTTHPLEALPPDAAHHAKWCLQSQATKELAHHRIQIHPLFEVTQAEAWLQAVSHTGAYPHLVIDAFLGMGNNRPLSGCMAQVATWLYDSQQSPFTQPKIVSIDVPSGLSPAMDTLPENPKHFIHPDITLSIGGQALVHVGSHTRHVCGEVMPISLGITPPIEQFPPIAYRITEEAILEAQKRQTPEPTSHKYQRGKICVIGGSLEYPNAPWLSAKASVLAGAGMVWMAHGHSHYHPDAQENTLKAIPYQMPSPENACGSILALGETLPLPTITTQPKADMQTRGSTTENARTHFDSHAFQAIHEACIARRPEVCVIGPGLGRHPHTLEAFLPWLVKLLESLPDLYAILDADALYALGYGLYHTSPALPLLNQHSLWQRCILTPHMGEARQLEQWLHPSGTPHPETLGLLKSLAQAAPWTVLLKGSTTWVHTLQETQESIPIAVPYGTASLAQGGSGDKLAGYIAGYLKRSASPSEACWLATTTLAHHLF